ncbi:hypothetical protein [Tautonia plasticadhaerens]|uniref:DUF5667 domain-containing protein n=1 Tax=Tautonia plasticadhaerens TaxID=2527974 RepID=A0A518GW98_9BACT|nr:hypothetical protein [Tautonia plasticadhaerens]QDV32821.1 hypothetical protein ElP_06610 [Tautonia plasticadhaerens]
MHLSKLLPRGMIAPLTAAILILAVPDTGSAQLGAAGPYGAMGNYGYFGGAGPYGWGPYSFGWGGFTTAGTGPAMPPAGAAPDPRYQILTARMARPNTTNDLLQRQQMAASYRERQRQALSMQARYDVSTGRPRMVPSRLSPEELPLAERIKALFEEDGTLSWPAGLDSATPAARTQVEQAATIALEEYQLQGHAEVADVTFARQRLSEFAGPVLSRVAATDDPLSYQAAVDFLQRLDATLIDLADPPVPGTEPESGDEPTPAGGPDAPR